LLVLVFAAACGGGGGGTDIPDAGNADAEMVDAGDVPDADTTPAQVDVSWTIVDNGAPAACPAGATDAVITSLRQGDTTPYVDIYDCTALAGTVSDLPPGSYQIWIDLTDSTGVDLYAESETATMVLEPGGGGGAQFDIDGYNGFFDVSWNLHNAGGSATTCAAVANQNGVSVLSTNASTTDAIDDVYACEDGEGTARVTVGAFPLDSYVLALTLLDGSDNPIGDADPINATLLFGNQYLDVGSVAITLF
jgi:hypothetical protein